MKKCGHCQTYLDLEEFSSRKGQLQSYCKKCQAQKSKEYREKNKERCRQNLKNWRQKIKNESVP